MTQLLLECSSNSSLLGQSETCEFHPKFIQALSILNIPVPE